MGAKTFYWKNAVPAGATLHRSLQDGGTPPTTATTTTGWVAGTNATGQSCIQTGGTEYSRTGGNWGTTLQPASNPSQTIGDCWRSENTLNGTFASSNWTFTFGFRSVTAAYTGRIKLAVRLWRSSNANGTGAVELTSGRVASAATTANLSTSADTTLSWTWSPGAEKDFSNEYLFIQVGIEITSAGGGTTQDFDFRVGSAYTAVTPIFVNATVASTTNSAGVAAGVGFANVLTTAASSGANANTISTSALQLTGASASGTNLSTGVSACILNGSGFCNTSAIADGLCSAIFTRDANSAAVSNSSADSEIVQNGSSGECYSIGSLLGNLVAINATNVDSDSSVTTDFQSLLISTTNLVSSTVSSANIEINAIVNTDVLSNGIASAEAIVGGVFECIANMSLQTNTSIFLNAVFNTDSTSESVTSADIVGTAFLTANGGANGGSVAAIYTSTINSGNVISGMLLATNAITALFQLVTTDSSGNTASAVDAIAIDTNGSSSTIIDADAVSVAIATNTVIGSCYSAVLSAAGGYSIVFGRISWWTRELHRPLESETVNRPLTVSQNRPLDSVNVTRPLILPYPSRPLAGVTRNYPLRRAA